MPTKPFTRSTPGEFSAWISAQAIPVTTESVPLHLAGGRVLAEPVIAPRDVPDGPTAADDGYALRAADTLGASDYSPLPLRLLPGNAPVVPGTCCHIARGDPLLDGADAVLPFDLGDVHGGILEVAGAVPPGSGVSPLGEECAAGELLLAAGRRLRPQDVALLAVAGIRQVAVRRRPSVRVILAGRYRDDADGPLLTSLIARDGGRADGPETAAGAEALGGAISRPGADLILVAGATGRGADDHAPRVLAMVGELAYHGVSIDPGESTGLGRVRQTPVVLIPGTPLACLFVYDLFVAPLLRRAAGLPGPWPYRSRCLPLTRKVASGIGRLELCRVRVVNGEAEPIAILDGRVLNTAVEADGFTLVPVQSEGYAEGAEITVHLYDDPA